jgi:hypothetical protein
MGQHKFDTDVNLSSNQLLKALLERVDNNTMPLSAAEGRVLYHLIKKVPAFYNGLNFEFLVTESYVSALLGGLAWKDDVEAVSDVNVPLTNLINGVTVDDIVLGTGNRVLLLAQTDPRENGVWLVGNPATRPFDLDDSGDFNNAVVPVKDGTTYKGWQFRCKNIDPDLGIDAIEFVDMTPSVPDATEAVKGKIRIALLAAVLEGLEGDTAVTPLTLKAALDPIRNQLASLAPAPPNGLTGRSLSMSVYTALAESSGVTHNCTDDLTPDGTVSNFFDGDAGDLTAEIDASAEGSQTLSTASDIGVYGALNIIDDSDPIPAGQMGHGLYKQLSAFIRPVSDLSLGEHTYKMIHSLTGETNVLTFYTDDPGSVTITGAAITLPTLSRYVSGVPSLAVGDTLLVDFNVNGAVMSHYNPTRLARLSGLQTETRNIAPPGTPPSSGSVVSYTSETLEILAGSYSENVEISISGYNSKDVQGAILNENINSRVDTMSNEALRKEAGSGLYPAAGYGGTFGSTYDLKTYYTEELQLLNGKFQRPSGNYSGNQPVAGPDYSSGMGTDDRWVLFDLGINLSNASSLILTLPSIEGSWSGVETSGIKIQVKVEGETGWMDANKAFALVGAPSGDGDACMVYADSTENVKKVSFGNTPRSGALLVRIGLPDGSDKKFGQGVTVTNIV